MRASSERQRLDNLLKEAKKGPNRLDGVAGLWVQDCWFESIVVANNRKRVNRRYHLICRYVTYVGALVLPILSGLAAIEPDSPVRIWTFIVSLVTAVAAAALQVFKFGQQWRIHDEFAAAMEAEGWSYFLHQGVYRNANNPYDDFFARVEWLRKQRGAQFILEVAAEVANLEGTHGADADSQPIKDPNGQHEVGRTGQTMVGRTQSDSAVDGP